MKTIRNAALILVVTGVAGCASTRPPQDIATAPDSHARTSVGPAATQATPPRKETVTKTPAPDTAQLQPQPQPQPQLSSAELGRANMQAEGQDRVLRAQPRQLNAARDRRNEDRRAARAAAALAAIAPVKGDRVRGLVITLSSGPLFASNRSELLPTAQPKLDAVADALTRGDADWSVVVEAYSDAQGGAAYNVDLSRRRAQAVRDYLVSRLVPTERVTAVGFGRTRPVADDASAEGRAKNSRVEILVRPASSR
jgi:outer membrane protein OmpA-like peptidoglycan-associated protein